MAVLQKRYDRTKETLKRTASERDIAQEKLAVVEPNSGGAKSGCIAIDNFEYCGDDKKVPWVNAVQIIITGWRPWFPAGG